MIAASSLYNKNNNENKKHKYQIQNHKKIEHTNYYEIQNTYKQHCYFIGRQHKSNRQTKRLFFNKYSHIKYSIFSCFDIQCCNKILYRMLQRVHVDFYNVI